MVLAAMMVGSTLAGKVEGHYVAGSRYESMSDSTHKRKKQGRLAQAQVSKEDKTILLMSIIGIASRHAITYGKIL
jgi:hypothetical protein